MKNPIILYPDNIRNQCGIDTVIFTYSYETASKLKSLLSDDFHIVFHNLSPKTEDEFEWMNEALYHSYLFILTPFEAVDAFICGLALGTALGQNSNTILTIGATDVLKSSINAVTHNGATHFENITELANYIEAEE